MVKAGKPVDAVIEELTPLLDEGDIIIDAGNSHFPDTVRRTEECAANGIRFMGVGVSGGEEGALLGPSIMPGGDPAAYAEVEEIFTSIAAVVDDTPCCVHVGPGGAGHYVKMVHNGIEYADIQLIAEAYDLLTHVAGLDAPAIAKIFEEWNTGDLDSFLIEITAKVLAKTDEKTGGPLVDVIVDQAEQKGTGTWTAVDALGLGRPAHGHHRGGLRARPVGAARRAEEGVDDAGRPRSGPGRGPRRPDRGHPPGALREQGRRLRAGLRADARRVGGQRLEPRPRRDGDDLARRLHHPRAVPQPDPRRLRRARRRREPADGAVLHRGRRERAGRVAAGGDGGDRAGRGDPGVLLEPVVLRRLPARARAGEPDPGPARLLRCAHLPAHRTKRATSTPGGARTAPRCRRARRACRGRCGGGKARWRRTRRSPGRDRRSRTRRRGGGR